MAATVEERFSDYKRLSQYVSRGAARWCRVTPARGAGRIQAHELTRLPPWSWKAERLGAVVNA